MQYCHIIFIMSAYLIICRMKYRLMLLLLHYQYLTKVIFQNCFCPYHPYESKSIS